VENSLYFNLADVLQVISKLSTFLSYYCLHFIKNIAYHVLEMLIFYADEVLAMGLLEICVYLIS